MKVYKFHEATKEFLYKEDAIADPLETELKGEFVPLIPANATLVEPPQKEGFAAVFVGGVWELQEDNRGKEYWLPGDEYGTPARTMKELGELPEGAVFVAPEKPAPTEAEIQAQLTQAVQAYMDSTAQTRGYDNIHTACSYSNSTDHIFAAEGQACLQWRDKVWRKCYDILAEVKAGTREIPTVEELIAELPVLEW